MRDVLDSFLDLTGEPVLEDGPGSESARKGFSSTSEGIRMALSRGYWKSIQKEEGPMLALRLRKVKGLCSNNGWAG